MPVPNHEPLTRLALTTEHVDRAAPERAAERFARTLADPATRVLELHGHRARVDGRHLALRAPQPDDAGRLALWLGRAVGTSETTGPAPGTAYVAVVGDPVPDEDPRAEGLVDLRRAGLALPDLEANLFATASALASWHETHTHCPRCGAETEPDLAGWVRRCRADGSQHFPRTDPAVIMAVVDDADRLLLGRNPRWPEGRFSVLAGFCEPGESLEAAVAREVLEEVGVPVTDVRYLGSQPWPFPGSVMLGFVARASATRLVLDTEEIAEAMWFTRAEYAAAMADGRVRTPGGISIARRLIERWYGAPIPATNAW